MDENQIRQTVKQSILSVVQELLPDCPQVVIEQRKGKITVVLKHTGVEVIFYNFDLTGNEDLDILGHHSATDEYSLVQHWTPLEKVCRSDSTNKE